MIQFESWSTERISGDGVGMESLGALEQSTVAGASHFFKPVTITAEKGRHYVTIYACRLTDGTDAAQSFAIWLASLSSTDYICLNVASLCNEVPIGNMLTIMSALASTKAYTDIQLDQVVFDNLAYFYLIASKITKGSAGSLYIPSYIENRQADVSGPWRAIFDFYKWVVEEAMENGRITEEDAARLHGGKYVIIPEDRFTA